MRVCQCRHDGLDTTAAVSATSAEVGRIRRTTKPAFRKELHPYSTEASLAVKPMMLEAVANLNHERRKGTRSKTSGFVPFCTLVPFVVYGRAPSRAKMFAAYRSRFLEAPDYPV